MTIKSAVRVESAQSRADRLVRRLQLADLRAGRELVESRVIREVEARRAVMAQVTEAVVGGTRAEHGGGAMSGVQKGDRVRLSESGARKWPHGRGMVFRVTAVRWCHAAKCRVIYAVEPTFGMPWEFLPQDVEEARNG